MACFLPWPALCDLFPSLFDNFAIAVVEGHEQGAEYIPLITLNAVHTKIF